MRKDDKPVLILDNADFNRDERLLKEAIGTEIFDRIIVIIRLSLFEVGNNLPVDELPGSFKVIAHLPMSRGDIRTLTVQYFDTSDENAISATVEKVYRDLVALCIPITPSNVIMYLTILYREGDFHPINRVEIVNKYLLEMLRRPSDAYIDSFNAKNKLDVISSFVFELSKAKKYQFTEADWFLFCGDHKRSTYTNFDDRSLLSELLTSRILVRLGPTLAFKYRFFHVFFLGRYVATRPKVLQEVIDQSKYLDHECLVEVITELTSDNDPLVSDIVAKLGGALSEFDERYVPETFDPFAQLQWPADPKEEEKLWTPLTKAIAEGPRNPSDIDEIKRSIVEENRASNQVVIVQKYDQLERRLVALHGALVEALRNSDNLNGEIKRQAVLTALKAYFRIYKIGLIFAPAIAEKAFYFWHGILFSFEDKAHLESLGDKNRKLWTVMNGVRISVTNKIAEQMGSKKLGEVFNLFARDKQIAGYLRVLNFSCLIRAKPNGWMSAVQETIANTDRKEFFLRSMLSLSVAQFRDEINTVNERADLKPCGQNIGLRLLSLRSRI
jgi:hypothetical protein